MILKQLWLHYFRSYIRLALFFFYKKIRIINVESVPKTGAVLFLGNHHNALMDALLIATKSSRFTYFLTRASVFQNTIISKFLKSLLMIPVYRVRDGWNKIAKNNAIFKNCAKLLGEDNALSLFPEANHNLKRTVRPLSKGFTRIVHETLEQFPELNLKIVPVGFNYKHADKFGDSVSLYFGNPIPITSEDTIDKVKSVVDLKEMIFDNLCKLTTHIPFENYEATLLKLENLNVDFLNPVAVNKCIAADFKNCEPSTSRDFTIFKKFFKFWLILALIVPYIIWKRVFQPKIHENEFMATFRFVVAISIVPIYVLALTMILFFLASFKLALLYFISVLIITLLAVKL